MRLRVATPPALPRRRARARHGQESAGPAEVRAHAILLVRVELRQAVAGPAADFDTLELLHLELAVGRSFVGVRLGATGERGVHLILRRLQGGGLFLDPRASVLGASLDQGADVGHVFGVRTAEKHPPRGGDGSERLESRRRPRSDPGEVLKRESQSCERSVGDLY